MTGRYEAELNRMRAIEDWRIPKAAALRSALDSLNDAITAVTASEAWDSKTRDAANAALTDIQGQIRTIGDAVTAIDSAVTQANNARRAANDAELPSATVDPFWANAAKGASFVVHPFLGPIAADKAIDVIGDFLGSQREAEAERRVKSIEKSLEPPTDSVRASAEALEAVRYDRMTDGPASDDSGGDGPSVDSPSITYPGGGNSPFNTGPGGGGYPTGGGGGGGGVGEYQPPVPTNPTFPTYPDDPTFPTYPDDPTFPTNPDDTGNWEYDPNGPDVGDGGDDPTVDFPGGGVLPGGSGGGNGGGSSLTPGGTFPGGGTPGGLLPGGAGGGGIGGIVGGGAGAAAIAAGSKIAGIGSMGALGSSGLGGASGAGLKAGGGLLGNSALGGAGGSGGAAGSARPGGIGGIGGVGGAGGTGGAAGSSGAAGSGMRPGMGMMGGAGGDEEEKAKRSGLGGPIAPKLEDEEERGPRAKGAQAGSRGDHAG